MENELPNPFLVIAVFFLALALVRIITTTAHELGHAMAGLILLKGEHDVYIGSFGDPDKGFHFKAGRIKFHIIYDPLMYGKGVFASKQGTSYINDFIITLAGPLASLLLAFCCIYIALATPISEMIQIAFYIFAGSAFMDFWHNIKPNAAPILLDNGSMAYNDGYMLMRDWAFIRHKKTIADLTYFYDQKLYHEGVQHFESKYGKNKNPYVIRLGIALYYGNRDFEKGMARIKTMEKKGFLTSDDYCTVGMFHVRKQEYEKAFDYYKKSLALNPANENTLNSRGYAYTLIGRYEDALIDLNSAIILNPELAFAYNNRGYANLKLGKLEDGLDDINTSLKLDEHNSYGYRNLGIYHFEKKDFQKAYELFQKAKKLDSHTDNIDTLLSDPLFISIVN